MEQTRIRRRTWIYCPSCLEGENEKIPSIYTHHVIYILSGQEIPVRQDLNVDRLTYSRRSSDDYSEPHYSGFYAVNLFLPHHIFPPDILSKRMCWIWHETKIEGYSKNFVCDECILKAEVSKIVPRSSGGNLSPVLFNFINSRFNWSIVL